MRHACFWEAAAVLFSRHQVDDERKRKIVRNVASFAELAESRFIQIGEKENRMKQQTEINHG